MFFEKKPRIFRFVTTPLEIPDITKFHPGNSTKPQVVLPHNVPPPPLPSPVLEMSKLKTKIPGTLPF